MYGVIGLIEALNGSELPLQSIELVQGDWGGRPLHCNSFVYLELVSSSGSVDVDNERSDHNSREIEFAVVTCQLSVTFVS